ncbi:MAG TPA: hypothetical protein VEG08_02770 [Terriglobales bacterium]|nr:hypothetical protein [Terriglobales bacterium]
MRIALRSWLAPALPAVLFLSSAAPAFAQDQPTIQKDSIVVKLQSFDTTSRNGVRRSGTPPSWLPRIKFRVNGPIASGSQLYVQFSLPTDKNWIRFDCTTNERERGKWLETECGNEVSEDKNTSTVGLVPFSIKMRNELQGTDLTLFAGKVKVIKVQPNPKNPADWEFFADEDWRIPIGFIFAATNEGFGSNPFLHVGFWYRGNPPDVEAHLFYNGKDIAKYKLGGNDASEWSPNMYQWGYVNCQFDGVYPGEMPPDMAYDPKFEMRKNPGEYEVKVLIVNHLARSIKFTVNADGSFDNGIATANQLGADRVIVPVQVIGSQTTNWDRTAWKTGAFYGNPLTGFTAVP